MSKLVTIYGGSGFVGRYIARRMAQAGWRVRVAVRRPNEALHVKPYGVVGQVEPVLCNVRNDASVRAAMAGADAVVMQEDCVVQADGLVRLPTAVPLGQWIRRAGEDVTRGAVVLANGERLTPAALGLAASIGMAQLCVARRPRVALFSTGDELVMPGQVAPQDMAPGSSARPRYRL